MLISVKPITKYVIIIYALGSVHESSASETKLFQSRSKGEIPGRARRKERLSRSKLKQAFLIDSDAKRFMNSVQCYKFPFIKRSASEPGLNRRSRACLRSPEKREKLTPVLRALNKCIYCLC